MMMSQDVWRTLCTKVDDLKLTNTRGNKIRGTMMPPIFSMDAQEASSRVQSKKETSLIIDTKSTGASFDPDTLGKARTMETDNWSHVTRW